jgi:hypothetical protein
MLAFVSCTRSERPKKGETGALTVKITQFYASPPVVPKGEKALLCYGVENAKAVWIEPAVEKLNPALTRCIEVTPAKTTSYTLTAEDSKGATVRQKASIQVGGAKPRMYDISINSKAVKPGQQVSFCFKASNARSVSGAPGKFLMKGNPQRDCLIDAPRKTTTYEIAVSNEEGLTDSASITVEVVP